MNERECERTREQGSEGARERELKGVNQSLQKITLNYINALMIARKED